MIVRNICSRSNEMSAHHRAKSPLTISEMCTTPAPNVRPVWNWLELAAVMLACGLIPPMTLNGAVGFTLCWPSSHAKPPLA